MLEMEDTKVFTGVELGPKSVFSEQRKHVKHLFFFRVRKEKRRPSWIIQILVSYLVY